MHANASLAAQRLLDAVRGALVGNASSASNSGSGSGTQQYPYIDPAPLSVACAGHRLSAELAAAVNLPTWLVWSQMWQQRPAPSAGSPSIANSSQSGWARVRLSSLPASSRAAHVMVAASLPLALPGGPAAVDSADLPPLLPFDSPGLSFPAVCSGPDSTSGGGVSLSSRSPAPQNVPIGSGSGSGSGSAWPTYLTATALDGGRGSGSPPGLLLPPALLPLVSEAGSTSVLIPVPGISGAEAGVGASTRPSLPAAVANASAITLVLLLDTGLSLGQVCWDNGFLPGFANASAFDANATDGGVNASAVGAAYLWPPPSPSTANGSSSDASVGAGVGGGTGEMRDAVSVILARSGRRLSSSTDAVHIPLTAARVAAALQTGAAAISALIREGSAAVAAVAADPSALLVTPPDIACVQAQAVAAAAAASSADAAAQQGVGPAIGAASPLSPSLAASSACQLLRRVSFTDAATDWPWRWVGDSQPFLNATSAATSSGSGGSSSSRRVQSRPAFSALNAHRSAVSAASWLQRRLQAPPSSNAEAEAVAAAYAESLLWASFAMRADLVILDPAAAAAQAAAASAAAAAAAAAGDPSDGADVVPFAPLVPGDTGIGPGGGWDVLGFNLTQLLLAEMSSLTPVVPQQETVNRGGMIAGIVIACLVIIAVVAFAVWWRRTTRRATSAFLAAAAVNLRRVEAAEALVQLLKDVQAERESTAESPASSALDDADHALSLSASGTPAALLTVLSLMASPSSDVADAAKPAVSQGLSSTDSTPASVPASASASASAEPPLVPSGDLAKAVASRLHAAAVAAAATGAPPSEAGAATAADAFAASPPPLQAFDFDALRRLAGIALATAADAAARSRHHPRGNGDRFAALPGAVGQSRTHATDGVWARGPRDHHGADEDELQGDAVVVEEGHAESEGETDLGVSASASGPASHAPSARSSAASIRSARPSTASIRSGRSGRVDTAVNVGGGARATAVSGRLRGSTAPGLLDLQQQQPAPVHRASGMRQRLVMLEVTEAAARAAVSTLSAEDLEAVTSVARALRLVQPDKASGAQHLITGSPADAASESLAGHRRRRASAAPASGAATQQSAAGPHDAAAARLQPLVSATLESGAEAFAEAVLATFEDGDAGALAAVAALRTQSGPGGLSRKPTFSMGGSVARHTASDSGRRIISVSNNGQPAVQGAASLSQSPLPPSAESKRLTVSPLVPPSLRNRPPAFLYALEQKAARLAAEQARQALLAALGMQGCCGGRQPAHSGRRQVTAAGKTGTRIRGRPARGSDWARLPPGAKAITPGGRESGGQLALPLALLAGVSSPAAATPGRPGDGLNPLKVSPELMGDGEGIELASWLRTGKGDGKMSTASPALGVDWLLTTPLSRSGAVTSKSGSSVMRAGASRTSAAGSTGSTARGAALLKQLAELQQGRGFTPRALSVSVTSAHGPHELSDGGGAAKAGIPVSVSSRGPSRSRLLASSAGWADDNNSGDLAIGLGPLEGRVNGVNPLLFPASPAGPAGAAAGGRRSRSSGVSGAPALAGTGSSARQARASFTRTAVMRVHTRKR